MSPAATPTLRIDPMSTQGRSDAPRRVDVHDFVDAFSVAVSVALVVVIARHGPVALRLGLLIPFVLFIPGWSVVTNSIALKSRAPVTLSVLVSLALLTIVSTVPLWFHYWRPLGTCQIYAAAASCVTVLGFVRRTLTHPHPATNAVSGSIPRHFRYSDTLPFVGLTLWAFGIAQSRGSHELGKLGPLSHLSPLYYAGLGVFLLSFVIALNMRQFSRVRASLHLSGLVVMLFGTAPLLYAAPRYAWQYKLIGVIQYIQSYGRVDSHIDIYQNWPGLFASVAWLDRVGHLDPLLLAKWAQPGFELLTCLMLAFAFRAVMWSDRERWLALGIYVVSTWVAQDYLSPQAFAAVLSAGVLGIALHWFTRPTPRPLHVPRWLRRMEQKLDVLRAPLHQSDATATEKPTPKPTSRLTVLVEMAFVGTFAVLVAVHELTPYAVLIQLGVLVLIRRFRPGWVYGVLVVIALGYLAPRFQYVNSHFGLLASIGNFFGNAKPPSASLASADVGIQLSHDAAVVLSLGVWFLAALGAFRCWRAREPWVIVAALAGAPVLIVVANAYGGEAILRVFLYSVPWSACLAARGLRPIRTTSAAWAKCALQGGVLLTLLALLLPAFFGQDDLNVIPSAQVTAVVDFYRVARPGVIYTADENFPAKATKDYFKFDDVPIFGPGTLLGTRVLTPRSGRVITLAVENNNRTGAPSYVMVTGSMLAYAAAYRYPTHDEIATLTQDLRHDPGWIVVMHKSGVWIFEFP